MRFAPQGDLRRYLLRNFDNLSLPNKLGIAQTICAELEKIHSKGWVHGDLHCGNILLLNEENAFISDFGMCRPTDALESKDKLYGVIPNIAPEIIHGHPRSQAGDIYSLGIVLWELVCGVIAFADRSHDVHLIVDICDGLRPQTCHFAPPVYNDLLERCWNRDPSKRPCIKDVLNSIEFWCYHRRQTDVVIINNIIGSNLFRSNYKTISNNIRLYDKNDRFEKNGFHKCGCFDETITNQLANSQNAGYIYTLMNWKPNKPIHSEAVYSSRTFSYKSLQDEIDILLSWRKSNQKSNQSSIVK
ncbi:kinase-like protein [Rhizophagus irregularis]|uniref:Kinase-like protein n=2 Tax=Rhizophagus irregularis TaxID=588596 RepID=A0A2N1MWF1_9GLOM|nr:kinase-like protein [Rhizophagus irregularis]